MVCGGNVASLDHEQFNPATFSLITSSIALQTAECTTRLISNELCGDGYEQYTDRTATDLTRCKGLYEYGIDVLTEHLNSLIIQTLVQQLRGTISRTLGGEQVLENQR